jgi:hypothetical protein
MKHVRQSVCAYIFMQATRHKFQMQTWMYWILMKHSQSIFQIHNSEWKDRGGGVPMQRRVFNWNRTRLLLRDSFRVSCIRFFVSRFCIKMFAMFATWHQNVTQECQFLSLTSFVWNIDAIKNVKCVLTAVSPVLSPLKPLSLFLFRSSIAQIWWNFPYELHAIG